MTDFPLVPIPSSISAPEVIDPMIRSQMDQGYEVRRSLHSRPRFRYTLEWLGKRTDEMRYLRDFLMFQRLGTLPFRWFHGTAQETGVEVRATTPVILYFPYGHGMYTGMWIIVSGAVGVNAAINTAWQVTRADWQHVYLNGSTNMGVGTCTTGVFMPRAVARFNEDTWPSPVKLIGPERMYLWQFQLFTRRGRDILDETVLIQAIAEKNRLESDHVLTCLFQVEIPGAPLPLRLANYDQHLVFHGLSVRALAGECG